MMKPDEINSGIRGDIRCTGLLGECTRQILDWIYPRNCEVCGEGPLNQGAVCEECFERLERMPRPLCFRCGSVVPGSAASDDSCDMCRHAEWEFDFARSALVYYGVIRDLVLTFKYRRGIYLGETFSELMLSLRDEYGDCLNGVSWVLVPVPVSRRKLMGRGFNQAEELARHLGKAWGFPVLDALVRRDDSVSQTSLGRKGRMKHARNLYGADSSCLKKGSLEGKNVLLIDDLFTTGSTANSCAGVLKRDLGAASAGVLTLARAVPWEFVPESLKGESRDSVDWG